MFLERFNIFHPNLSFTWEYSREFINFLDVRVSVEDAEFKTDLYCKPTDCHQFLHFDSSHPTHVKKSIVYSQALRIKRLCSSESDLSRHLEEMRGWFCERGYPEDIVDKQFARINVIGGGNGKIKSKERKGIPFVVTYHPCLANLNNILRKHLYLLNINPEIKDVFAFNPFVSFRAARTLRNFLVRAKIYPLQRRTGSCTCQKKSCRVCLNICESDQFTCSVDKKVYKINHYLNCDSKLIVYLLTCKRCGIQYVGQTTDKFRYRWNNYKACQRKASMGVDVPQRHLHEHFLGEGHTGLLNDVEIRLIDKTDPSQPTSRELYWIERLKTQYPQGLNS